ncbi:hypothetical protein IT570_07315 [Candidatus Sumerlaeota bacterium]|nr:hypothetical protein [Candidatus Sumerlaeota bacterium]
MMGGLREHLERKPWLVSLALAIAFLPIKLYGSECGYLNMHAARDWERGWQMWHGVQPWWNGPELLFRGAIPGFFFNVLAGIFQLPARNPIFASYGPGFLFCGAIFFFHDGVRRVFSPAAALWGTLLFASQPLGTIALRYLWNPSYLFVFSAIALWCVARAVGERRGGWMSGALMATLLAAQIHLSAYSATLAVVLMMIRSRLFPRWWQLLLVIAIFAATVTPYFVSQYLNAWTDQAALRQNELEVQLNITRILPNPTFFPPFGIQFWVQPSHYFKTFPFSYYERFYEARRAFAWLGSMGFVLTVPLLVAAFGGMLAGMRKCCFPEAGGDLKRMYLQCAAIYLIACCIPQIFWNPGAKSGLYANNANFGVPIRYLLIFWPSQFILMTGALEWIFARRRFALPTRLWLSAAVGVCLMLTVLFNWQGLRTGEPFNYLHLSERPVHAVRDKFALARHLVNKWGVDDATLQARVHTAGFMMTGAEESMDYEIRAALEMNPAHPVADPGVFYFLCEAPELARVKGDAEILEQSAFGGIGLTVYRPRRDMSAWQVDAPLSWWWY